MNLTELIIIFGLSHALCMILGYKLRIALAKLNDKKPICDNCKWLIPRCHQSEIHMTVSRLSTCKQFSLIGADNPPPQGEKK